MKTIKDEKKYSIIYHCKKCNTPLITENNINNFLNSYTADALSEVRTKLTSHISQNILILIIRNKSDADSFEKFSFNINFNSQKIFCNSVIFKKHCEIGFLEKCKLESLGMDLYVGFLIPDCIKTKKLFFKPPKNLIVKSQYKTDLLIKCKEAKYLVKTLKPSLEEAIEKLNEPKKKIAKNENKFNHSDISLVFNKIEECIKDEKKEGKKEEKEVVKKDEKQKQ